MEFRLFTNWVFNNTVVLGGLAGGVARTNLTFSFIIFFQGPYAKGPLMAGILLIPFGLGIMFAGMPSGQLADSLGFRSLCVVGLALASVANLIMPLVIKPDTNTWVIFALLLANGLGWGLYSSPSASISMLGILPQQRASSSSLRIMFIMLSQMIAIVICFKIIISGMPPDAVQELFIYGGGIESQYLDSFMSGWRVIQWITFAITAVCCVCAWKLPLTSVMAMPEEVESEPESTLSSVVEDRNGSNCRFFHDGFSSIPRAMLAEEVETTEETSISPGHRSESVAETASSSTSSRPAYAASRPCHWYMAGYCLRGDSCWFSHDRSAINGSRREIVDLSDEDETTTGVARQPHESHEDNNDEEDEDQKCAICFEIPKTFGLLVSCNHAFCLTCIRTWRSKETAADLQSYDSSNASVTKACPNCRTPSLYVVPSSFFPTCTEQKDIIIQNYKEAAGRKTCKYFAESGDRHWCPFGDGCFFAHLDGNGEHCKVNPDSNPRRNRQRRIARVNRERFGHRDYYNAFIQMRREVLETMRASNPDSVEDDFGGLESLLERINLISTTLQSNRANMPDTWRGSRHSYNDDYDDGVDYEWYGPSDLDFVEDDEDNNDEGEDLDDGESDYGFEYHFDDYDDDYGSWSISTHHG
ncbi:hypothetical protein BGX27_009291 [Mortierella sp. AM989]|nr:hypothetical protein BGX27_009291 [Mortierella sp. AM989]